MPAQPGVPTPVPDHTAVLPGVPHVDFVRLCDDLVAVVARADIPLARANIVLARAASGELVVRVSSDDAFLRTLRQ